MLLAKLREAAQISLPCPVKDALHLLNMIPEDVGRNNLNSRRLHLEDLLLPPILGIAGELKLSHDRKPWLTVERQKLIIQPDGFPGWRKAAAGPEIRGACRR